MKCWQMFLFPLNNDLQNSVLTNWNILNLLNLNRANNPFPVQTLSVDTK